MAGSSRIKSGHDDFKFVQTSVQFVSTPSGNFPDSPARKREAQGGETPAVHPMDPRFEG
jgi:hypothetical protein